MGCRRSLVRIQSPRFIGKGHHIKRLRELVELLSVRLGRTSELCAAKRTSVWIARAEEVIGRIRATARVSEIVESSVRLDCILPCIDGPGPEGTGRARKGFALRDDLPSYGSCVAAIEKNARLRDQFEGAMRIALGTGYRICP